jgi:superfamily II DNA or RNA helicase
VTDDKPIRIPPKFWFSKQLGKNSIRQLKFPSILLQRGGSEPRLGAPGQQLHLHGQTFLISKTRRSEPPSGFDDVLFTYGDNRLAWSRESQIIDPKWAEVFERRDAVAANLKGRFTLIEEERNADLTIKRPGLRSPQTGAIYAALGYWKMSSDVATIVLPTGTGKTDCMVALMALKQPKCLLVVVPTDALRIQLADKFMSLGVLVEFGLLPTGSLFPIVGTLRSRFESLKEMKVFCDASNVIVTTMPLLGRFNDEELEELASLCDYLFIDEAHHVKATTWSRLRSQFAGKPVLQFTATPYRNDGQHVDGTIIFNYPLRMAQAEGYFKKLILKELWEYVDVEESVAKAAIDQLVEDLKNDLDHIVMARADSISRAEDLKTIYDELAPRFSPVVVHSRLPGGELKKRLNQLYERKSRVVICVAMFGEGFDFPELKIAALHDIHQSLAVTIQFTGRFTRPNPRVGNATIIVNRAVTRVNESVRDLYAQGGGADWNQLLTTLTEGATAAQINKNEFYDSFASAPFSAVPIQNITPKMSTVAYLTSAPRWTPWKINDLPIAEHICGQLRVSLPEGTAYFITLEHEPVVWADTEDLTNRTYDLYALFWDPSTKLLYINSSNNDSLHEELAKAAGGDDARLISGVQTFRVLHGIKRLLLRNMGLNDRLRRSVRFMMYTGSDIRAYLDSSQTHGKEKTHVFGDGFNGKSRVTIGTSKKGRIWSWQEAKDLLDWKQWCKGVGAKLLDETIQPDSFLQDFMMPEDISTPPDLYPLTIEWPDELYQHSEQSVFIEKGDVRVPFFDVGFELIDPAPAEALRFRVFAEEFSATYNIVFRQNTVAYLPESEDLSIRVGKRIRTLSEFFGMAQPIVRYEQDCFSKGDQLLRPRSRTLHTFNSQKVLAWDWNGVDLTKESQTRLKRPESIQRRTIETVSSTQWDRAYQIVFDDDSPGEAADVVCVVVSNEKLLVDLFHCKFTKKKAGIRTDDLYVACGQAQRSVKWKDDIDRFFMHLINRERKQMQKHRVSRFERGDFKLLQIIHGESRALTAEFRIFVVQPGVSKEQLSDDQRELLASTELYLQETRGIEFRLIASD